MPYNRDHDILLRTPIEIADMMLRHALLIACGYLHDEKNIVSNDDLAMFDLFVEELYIGYTTAANIVYHLRRCHG